MTEHEAIEAAKKLLPGCDVISGIACSLYLFPEDYDGADGGSLVFSASGHLSYQDAFDVLREKVEEHYGDDGMMRPEDIHPHRPGYLPANGEGR